MRLAFSLIFLCVLTSHINCFFGFLNPSFQGNFFENGLLEPLVHDVHRERKAERYHAQDLARMDELMNNAAEQKELVRELVESLPADHAYFVQSNDLQPHRQRHHALPHIAVASNDEDYFEPRQESVRFTKYLVKKSMPVQRIMSEESGSSEVSLEQDTPVSIDNNPLENFLESLVGSPAQSSEEETSSSSTETQDENPVKWNEKRTYLVPEPIKERSESGLVDLITNPDQAYYNGQDSGEYSNENQDQQVLILSPVATNLWQPQSEEQLQTQSQEIQEPTYKQSYGGLIDLLSARLREPVQHDLSSNEHETSRHHQKSVDTPNMWIDEEKSVLTPLTRENGLSSWQKDQHQNGDKRAFENIKSNLNEEQENFINALHQQNSRQQTDENGIMAPQQDQFQWLIQIKLDKNVEKHEAEDLLSFISQLTAVDSSLIKDTSVGQNSISFRLDSSDLSKKDVESFVQEILNHEQQIKHEKGLKILAASLVNNSTDDHVEIQSLWEKDQSRKYFLVIVTVCGSALSVLVTLLSIFVVRRRAYLRNKLRNELNLPKKKKFEDVERLVEGDVEQSRLKRFWNKLFCKKNTEEVSQSHDLTPGNDAEKALSRQSHQDYQELCRTEEFVPTHLMTTPVTTNTDMSRKTNVAESNRSSTSS